MRMYFTSIRKVFVVGCIVFVVASAMVFQSTDAKRTMIQSNTTSLNYPENEHGQTYGSAQEDNSADMLPDLIHAGSVNGIQGYLLKKITSVNLAMFHCMMLMGKR